MKKTLLILIKLVLLPFLLQAQSGITFERTYGLPGYNYGINTIQTSDSGFIVLGNRSGFIGNSDIYLLKIDKLGNIIWDKAFGNSSVEWGTDLKITSDNHYLISGYTNQNSNSGYDVFLLKVDTLGNQLWFKTYGGSDWDLGFSVIESSGNNYYITGQTFSFGSGGGDVYLIKTSSNGDTIWTKTYGGIAEDAGLKIIPVQNGQFLISGFTNSFGYGMKDCYALKIDSNGDTIYTKTYGSSGDEKAYDVIVSNDNNYIFCGYTDGPLTPVKDGLIFQTDTNGNKMWEGYGGYTNEAEIFSLASGDHDDLYFNGNTTFGDPGNLDIFIIKLDNNGYAGGNVFGSSYFDEGNRFNRTFDKGFILTGSSAGKGPNASDIYIIKIDSLMQNDTSCAHFTGISKIKNLAENVHIYPNPAKYEFFIQSDNLFSGLIQINIYNILGQRLYNKKIAQDTYSDKIHLRLPAFRTGNYILELRYETGNLCKKISIYTD